MKNDRLVPILIIYFAFGLATCQEKSFKQDDIELNGKNAKAPTVIQELKKRANKVFVNKQGFLEAEFRDGIVLIYIPSGKFIMGTTKGEKKELPEHTVHLTGYWIGKYPVTVAQFKVFMKETDYVTDSEAGQGWTDASGELSLAEGGHSIRSDMRERTDQFSSDDHLGFRVTVSYY